MDSIAYRAAVAVALALLGVLAYGAIDAGAFTNSYCGVLINEFTWCGDGSNHSYNYNEASYTGTGNVWVCERLLYADTTTQVESPRCAYNVSGRSFTPGAFLTEAEVDHETGTGARHTIYGYATA